MPRRAWAVFLILPATATLYLGYVVWLGGGMGFPLDDAWIHQTFARNLIQQGEFAYNPGEPSTASTSPFWSLLLALGYVFPGGSRLWTYALGLLFLGLTAYVGYLLSRRLFPLHRRLAILAAAAILLEWRLDWAALSGMETVLFAFSCLSLIYLAALALMDQLSLPRVALLGAAAGLASVVRPEGVSLAILSFGAIVWSQKRRGLVVPAVAVWLVFLLPLVAFNLAVSGTPLPSTFYAKGAAYAQPLSIGFVLTFIAGAVITLASGSLGVLVPGVAYVAYRVIRGVRGQSSRDSAQVTAFDLGTLTPANSAAFAFVGLWVISLIVLYLVRLPALFHHGRYLMPLIPPLTVVGLGGLVWLRRAVSFQLLARVYAGLAVLVFLVFWINGAVVYGWDVKFIDDEEVSTALWLDKNTASEALIATHDIGAIGYFSNRRIVDAAGLSPP
ncbi:MAG: hypothetical protein M1358_06130, partial [Chloroflexi bacterium]|nr:hypothetical protein [Chloroflexota bacterium]